MLSFILIIVSQQSISIHFPLIFTSHLAHFNLSFILMVPSLSEYLLLLICQAYWILLFNCINGGVQPLQFLLGQPRQLQRRRRACHLLWKLVLQGSSHGASRHQMLLLLRTLRIRLQFVLFGLCLLPSSLVQRLRP